MRHPHDVFRRHRRPPHCPLPRYAGGGLVWGSGFEISNLKSQIAKPPPQPPPGVNANVNLDTMAGTLSSLTIDALPASSITLSQSDFTLAATNETIGNTGIGIFTQTGGSHAVNNQLDLGSGIGGRGTYNMNGG